MVRNGTAYRIVQVVLTFESVDEILNCDHSNESHCAVLSHGAVLPSYSVKLSVNSQRSFPS